MPRNFWWETTKADQYVQVQNFSMKIEGYAVPLGLSPAEVTDALGLCEAIMGAYTLTENSRATMQALTQWRDLVYTGEPEGSAAPAAPVFPVAGALTYKVGSVKLFFALRDRIVASAGYTTAIGEDLGIIGSESAARPESEVTPDLKPTVSNGNFVNLAGSMQGMDALRVEYRTGTGEFQTVAFLTNTPGGFQITPTTPNQPEIGFLRAVFIKKNEEYGNFSPTYQVTVS